MKSGSGRRREKKKEPRRKNWHHFRVDEALNLKWPAKNCKPVVSMLSISSMFWCQVELIVWKAVLTGGVSGLSAFIPSCRWAFFAEPVPP